MIEANRYKLGVFVTIAISMIVASFLLIGMSEIFAPKILTMTVFRDSVEGLKIGSPVKYKGVALGRVTRIAIRDCDEFVNVYMVISSAAMDRVLPDEEEIIESNSSTLNSYLMKLKTKGIRCSLQSAGITGGAFIELDCYPDLPPPPAIHADKDYLYIPSRPSHVTEVIENLSKIAETISKINFVEFKDKLEKVLDTVDERLNSDRFEKIVMRIDSLSAEFEKAGKTFNTSVTSEKLKTMLDDFTKTTKAIGMFADNANNKIDDIESIRKRLNSTLAKFEQTLGNLNEFISSLDDDPASLLRGKEKPKTIK
jgi:ABC-type transporter Mla subunit MlaD